MIKRKIKKCQLGANGIPIKPLGLWNTNVPNFNLQTEDDWHHNVDNIPFPGSSPNIKSALGLWDQNANIDMLSPQNSDGIFNMSNNQSNRDIITQPLLNPDEEKKEDKLKKAKLNFGFNPEAYAKLQGLNSIVDGIGNIYQQGQQAQNRINMSPLSGLQYANGRSDQSKYGYSFQKGGSKQNQPKVYTDRKQFEQAQRMYNDSLNLYNVNQKDIMRFKQLGQDIPLEESDKFLNYQDPLGLQAYNSLTKYNKKQPAVSSWLQSYVTKDGKRIGTMKQSVFQKPVQPVVYQPPLSKLSEISVSKNTSKKPVWKGKMMTKEEIDNNIKGKTRQQLLEEDDYMFENKYSIHPTQKMKRINPQQRDLNSNTNIQGQQVPFPQFQFPQQKGNPIYGPGNTIVGYSDNMNFKPAYEYTGAPNSQLNLQDKELLNNPEALRKYILSKDNYKFQKGGLFEDDDDDFLFGDESNYKQNDAIESERTTDEEVVKQVTKKPRYDYVNDPLGLLQPLKRRGYKLRQSIDNTYATPSENLSLGNQQAQVYEHLQNSGLTKEAIAGMMANIQHESNFNSGIPGDNGTSFGLFQHHAGRKDNLFSYLKSNNLPLNSVKGQIDFALKERPDIIRKINNAKTPQEAADIWTREFEIPANVDIQSKVRQRTSLNYYQDGGQLSNWEIIEY